MFDVWTKEYVWKKIKSDVQIVLCGASKVEQKIPSCRKTSSSLQHWTNYDRQAVSRKIMENPSFCSKTRRVSVRQLDLLWEFLNSHKDLAVAFNRTLEAKAYSRSKWAQLAVTLNSQRDGAYKNWRGWSKYWVDFKAKLKRRSAALRAARKISGGEASIEPPLTKIEERFLALLGDNFGEGSPGVGSDSNMPPRSTTESHNNSCEEDHGELPVEVVMLPPKRDSPVMPATLESHYGPQPDLSSADEDTAEIKPEPIRDAPIAAPNYRRRFRRHERDWPMEASRRQFDLSMRTKAAVRSSQALESIAHTLGSMQSLLQNIERMISGALANADDIKLI